MLEFEFEAELVRWQGEGSSWHFIALPQELGEAVRGASRGLRGGFGSVKVAVQVGSTEWSTSLFPDSANGTYLLPIKAGVRKAEAIAAGDEVTVVLRLVGG